MEKIISPKARKVSSCNNKSMKEHTLYVSKGIADTWSSNITPFLVVVKYKDELELDVSATNVVSILFHFETSDSEALKINALI